jgi:dipeptidyl aminopeptidase/acylaminoacyl peptidase
MPKRTLQVEDLWRLARPAQPALSPDGAQLCVSVTTHDMETNKGTSKLWLLSTFGGEPRALTEAGEKDGSPQWSPDGRLVAFVAKRGDDEEAQVWVIAPDGGEARRVTRMPTGVQGIKWFPDAKRIAFISWVWPDALGYEALSGRQREARESKVKAHVVEQPAYRFWDHWLSDGRVPRLFVTDLEGRRIVDLFAGTPYELPRADPEGHHYDISPDGREIAFTYDPAPVKRFDHEYQVVALDLKERKFRVLSGKARLSNESPAYSPDGRHVAWLTRNLRRSAVAESRIALLDRKRGTVAAFPWGWDRSADAPLVWESDSRSIVFAAENQARRSVFRWYLGGKRPQVAALGGTVTEFSAAGGALAFVRSTMSTPPQVFSWTAARGERRIDRFNDEVMDGVAAGEVREYEIRGWNGEPVQMWVILPPGFDPARRYPLLHNIHGGPHSTWGDNFHFRWNNQVLAAQGYVVACVNYHGSSSFGQRFLESIDCDWGRREYADIEAGTDFLLKKGWIDPKRLLAAGGSYGGYLVAWMNGHTDRYKAYVCHAGCFDWVSMISDDVWYWHPKELGAWYWDDPRRVDAQSPRAFVKRMKTPTLVIHGREDYRVPDAQGLAYFNTLMAKGVPARLVFFPDENHWILKPQNSRLWYREFFAWLARFAKPGPGKRR